MLLPADAHNPGSMIAQAMAVLEGTKGRTAPKASAPDAQFPLPEATTATATNTTNTNTNTNTNTEAATSTQPTASN
jgi:hypothetical protein